MSVDLLMGVINAADPARAQQARAKVAAEKKDAPNVFQRIFAGMSGKSAKAEPSEKIGDILAGVIAKAEPQKKMVAENRLLSLNETTAPSPSRTRSAAQQLEETLLVSLVDKMVPKETDSLYGSDEAGLARQFQVDSLAQAAAESGSLGLADHIAGERKSENLMGAQQWPYFARKKITPFAA